MTRSRALSEIIDAMPPDFADPAADYLAVRAMFAPFHGHPVGQDLQVEKVQYRGVDCGVHTLGADTPERIAFHCHGGAFVSTPLDQYHFYAEIIARETGCKVVMPDYRLAPEHPYPAAHEDCFNAWCGMLEAGVDPTRVVVMGESCGGSLAMGMLLRLRDEGLPTPACFISLTGWFDLDVAAGAPPGRDPFLTPEWVRNRARDYVNGQFTLEDPRVSPAYARLHDLPPMYLQLGEFDTMAPGARQMGEKARSAGVSVTLEDWPGAVQGWHGLVNVDIPEAQDAWRAIRKYIDRAIPDRSPDPSPARETSRDRNGSSA